MTTRLKSFAIVALGTLFAAPAFGASFFDKDNHKETNFNDGKTAPFVQRTTKDPSYARVVSKRLKCKWFESGWNGSRNTKGAEIWSQIETHNAYFVGFKFRVPKADANVSFPDDKNTIVHQNMQRKDANGGSTWHAVFEILNNKLVLTRRTGNNDRHTEHTIINSLTRDRDYEIQTRIQPDPDGSDGRIEIWVDGTRVVNVTDRVGFGIYDRTIKFGIYAYDDSNFSNNETRTLYYDNISVVVTNKNSGLNTVDPG